MQCFCTHLTAPQINIHELKFIFAFLNCEGPLGLSTKYKVNTCAMKLFRLEMPEGEQEHVGHEGLVYT